MDLETGYKWLSRARFIEWSIRDLNEEIEGLYSCIGLQGISYDKCSVISSPDNKFERIMGEIDKKKRELEKLKKRKEDAVYEIIAKINNLDPSPERTVLMSYYVGCKSMKKISEEIGYELSYIYKLQKKGIRKL